MKAKRLRRRKRPASSRSPSQCRNQGAVHGLREQGAGVKGAGCRVQQPWCGARHSLQRCRKQGAVHAVKGGLAMAPALCKW